MNLHDGDRGCKDPIVSGGIQAGAVPCKPRLSKQSENKISPLSNENLGLNVGIVVLRKTKLYLDKTIKVESAESTSHTGNGSYKELSVFNRALGKGGGSGLRSAAEPAPGKPGIVLPPPAPQPGGARALPAKRALLSAAPAALEAISHSRELHQCSSAAGLFPMHLQTACDGLQHAGAASPPLLSQSVFCFSFSAGVALALTPGVHLTLGNTSPRGLSICILQNIWACILSYKSQISSSTGVSE